MSTKTGWVYCQTCGTDREIATLEDSMCPICDQFVTLPEPEPEVKPGRKAKNVVEPEPEPAKGPLFPEVQRIETTNDEPDPTYAPPKFDFKEAEAHPAKEMAARELCKRHMLPFIQRFRPKYTAGWVHKDICRRLERFIKQVEQRKSPRLLLMMPPRAGKSEIGSRHFAPWALGHHPDWEIIAASHTSSLSLSFSRYCRDILQDPAYRALFPTTRLDPASKSVENWNLTEGGGYLSAGVGTGITGRGAHILLLDDLVKDMEAADSDVIRDNTWEWYASTAYTRLSPGGGVIGIMTWWHEDDWAGRIQKVMESGEGDHFEIIRYPAINDQGDEYTLEDDTIVQIHPDSPVPPNSTLTRPMNTALHPERYDLDAMLRIKRNLFAAGQQRVWHALYQQNPIPDDGIFFTTDMFRFYPALPHPDTCHIYQAWDFAITEDQASDYTVGATIFQDERDNLYVVDIRRFKSGDSIFIVDEILDYAEEWKNKTGLPMLGFEDGQIWKTLQAQFDKRCEERKLYPSYEIMKPLTDKFARASPLRGRMQLKKVYFDQKAPWYRDLFVELTRFGAGGKHDDQVDALAWAIRLTLTNSAPRVVERTPKLKSWKDKLSKYSTRGGETTYMAG